MTAGRIVDPELPWGSWLRVRENGPEHVFVDDANGREWPSIRAAFWNGRLGMPGSDAQPAPGLLETIHAVLAACVRRSPTRREQARDICEGSADYLGFLHLWLEREELIRPIRVGQAEMEITAEGMAVLLMLGATRPSGVRQRRPSQATIRQLSEVGLGPERREERLARVEREAARWDAAFLRSDETGSPTIVLVTRADGPVPVRQTVWTLRFAGGGQRDLFYEWMCERLDRWPAWAEMSSDYGSERLTHHLLEVAAAALADVTDDAAAMSGILKD